MMTSSRKEVEKRRNPVESICRKIRAIRRRETTLNLARRVAKRKSSSPDSPQSKTKTAFGDSLRRTAATGVPVLDSHFSRPERKHSRVSCPEVMSLRTSTSSQPSSPQEATYSVVLASSENCSQLRPWSLQSPPSLKSQSGQGRCIPSKDLDSSRNANSSSTSVLGSVCSSGRDTTFSTPWDGVTRKLSLNDDGLKAEDEGSQEEGAYGACETHGEEFLAGIFQELDTKHTGAVGVDRIMAYLRRTAGQDSEDGDLEALGTMLDPENTNPRVDLDTFQGIVKEWVAHSRSRREGTRSRWSGSWDDSVFEPQEDVGPDGPGSELHHDCRAWRKEMSDLITCVSDLHASKQKLEEENATCRLALEAMEEANRQLAEDCTSLHLQMSSAQQAVRRESLLKEELEDLKVTMAASEEQKTMALAQNKQLEAEVRILILKIRALQEENVKNVIDIDSLEKKIEELSETKKECQMQLQMCEDMLLTKDASLQKKDLCIEELESTIMEYRSITENLREDKNNLTQELQLLQHKLIVNGIQVHDKGMVSEEEKSLYHELTLAQTAEGSLDEESPHSGPLSCTEGRQLLWRKLQSCLKPQRRQKGSLCQRPLTWKESRQCSPLLDALYLDGLTAIPGLELTSVPCVRAPAHAPCERPREPVDGALDVTRGPQCPVPAGGSIVGPDPDPLGCTTMSEDLSADENGAGRLYSESLPPLREYLTQPSTDHTSSSESTVTSSESGSDILHMTSGDLDCKSLCEKEEEAGSAPAMSGTSPAPGTAVLGDSESVDKAAVSHLVREQSRLMEAGEGLKALEDGGKGRTAGETEVSEPPKAPVKLVNFQQSENTSASEKEVEAEFLRLSLGLKCDWFTLEKRVRLEERSRDLAEENLKKEITNCLKLLESLAPLCEDDNQAQEIIKKLEKSITFLSQCTTRVASRAEMLGAINQESRVSKAVEVMIQHVENLKRMYAKEHAELEELKQALLQNERSFSPLEDEDDCQIKKRSSSLNSKPSSLRRVTIASLPRNLGNMGTVYGIDSNDRFSRRSSSWRVLGTKQSEQRPSLHRFISTYSWADADGEKCDVKASDASEPAGEEVVERTRKVSVSEKRSSPSAWDSTAVCSSVTSWLTHLRVPFSRANRVLWLSVVFIALFAALMSFLTGQFFQTTAEAAPTQEGTSWMSLEHILWPLTRLRHNGPPPV
ncbi:inositol 1,4,5-triphosphate receptor associated 2 isoform X2 [Mesocricetus auratus]|uniref:Inositol 1,4,5-triphosphate receptor associated 2 isoform X2 n=1 Tax=Mesocricetus auratus TaxID=10036 RepID=A0A3Q0CV78_MESAU|nr:inositol 1,4,5-triphosphate receptor associated 2 isoform X2 [Mesocricetus auratus]